MIRAMLKREIDRFERIWGYPSDYMRRLVDIDPGAALAFVRASGIARRNRGAPPALFHAAKIAAALHEDCGPCVQIAADMAVRGGVLPVVVRAVIAGEEAGMGAEALLGWRFARAVLARDVEAQDEPRRAIVARWGERALASVALAIAGVRLFPTVKQALGYGASCQVLTVAGEPVAPSTARLAA